MTEFDHDRPGSGDPSDLPKHTDPKEGPPSEAALPERSPESVEPRRARGLTRDGRVRATRASGAWVSIISVALIVIAMLIFIGQNSQKVAVNFLGFNGHFPLGLAILFAAVSGMLLVALPGAARIIELRRALRKNERDSHKR